MKACLSRAVWLKERGELEGEELGEEKVRREEEDGSRIS